MKPGFPLIFLTVILGVTLVCSMLTIIVYPTPTPTTVAPTPVTSQIKVEIEEVKAGNTVQITLAVQASGPQALLFDTPLLAGDPPTPESLERARFDLLDLATGGRARIALEFHRPGGDPPWTLVFNPEHTAENTVAPRVEVLIKP